MKVLQSSDSKDLTSLVEFEIFLTENQVEALLKIKKRTLQAWRLNGRGPRFVRISSRAVRYRQSDISQWVEERLRTSTAE